MNRLLTAGLAALLLAPAAQAADFYAGKTINLYIGQGAGGGYDAYGRLAARHLGAHLPGRPTIVPQNMPGAGGLKVASYLARVAPKDGTALAIAAESVALEQALEASEGDYDAGKLAWVGRIASTASIFFTWGPTPVKNIEDARRTEARFGSTGAGSNTGYMPRALNALAGTRFKVITGYNGSTEVMLALERGEVDGGFALWPELKQQRPAWMEPGKLNYIYLVAGQRAGDLPDVPTPDEVGQTADGKAVLKLLCSTAEIGRALFSTPGLPPERVAELRAGFAAMIKDAAFLEDAQKVGLRIDALSGEALQKLVGAVIATPQALVEKAKQARN